MEEVVRAQERALLSSDESSAGSSNDSNNTNSESLRKAPTTTQAQQAAADIAREHHDLFNLIALVRMLQASDNTLFKVQSSFSCWQR